MLFSIIKSWSSKIRNEQYVPVLFKSEIAALRACWLGSATPQQAQKAIKVIYAKLCLTGTAPYIPGDDGANRFLAGREHVGVALRDILNVSPQEGIDDAEFFNKRK